VPFIVPTETGTDTGQGGRYLQNRVALLGAVFEDETGTAVDPSPATATGTFSYQLNTTQTALLDKLTCVWTSSLGTVTSHAEIVGGFLFTVSQAQATTDIGTAYTVAQIQEARTYAEQELEDACGVAFVPRYRLDTVVRPNTALMLWPRLRAIRSLTLDGTASDVSTLTFDGTGILKLPWNFGWTSAGQVVVGYEHGYDAPPIGATRAALTIAKDYLTVGPVADRAIQQATDYGPVYLATPGFKGKRFGIPSVDAFVESVGYVVGVA
jgi:hypothetical protein